jgi:hypothetical protein
VRDRVPRSPASCTPTARRSQVGHADERRVRGLATLEVMASFTRLRVEQGEEGLGLDIVSHGEEAYATGEGAILVPV